MPGVAYWPPSRFWQHSHGFPFHQHGPPRLSVPRIASRREPRRAPHPADHRHLRDDVPPDLAGRSEAQRLRSVHGAGVGRPDDGGERGGQEEPGHDLGGTPHSVLRASDGELAARRPQRTCRGKCVGEQSRVTCSRRAPVLTSLWSELKSPVSQTNASTSSCVKRLRMCSARPSRGEPAVLHSLDAGPSSCMQKASAFPLAPAQLRGCGHPPNHRSPPVARLALIGTRGSPSRRWIANEVPSGPPDPRGSSTAEHGRPVPRMSIAEATLVKMSADTRRLRTTGQARAAKRPQMSAAGSQRAHFGLRAARWPESGPSSLGASGFADL